MLPILFTLAVFVLMAKDHPGQRARVAPFDYVRVLRKRDSLRFCLFYSVTFGGFVGLATYLAIFFKDQYGVTKVTAGDLTALCVFAGSFARPLGGILADRFGGTRVLLVLLATTGAAALAMSSLPVLPVAFGLFLVLMALLGMGNGAVFQLVPQRFAGQIGVMTGLVGFAGGIGGFALPFLLGFFKDATGSYTAGFAVFGVVAILAAAQLLAAQFAWQRTWAPKGSAARNGRAATLPPVSVES